LGELLFAVREPSPVYCNFYGFPMVQSRHWLKGNREPILNVL
jgi:hypothetical protein